jgi:hypothetical protein
MGSGFDGSGSDNGIKHGWKLKNDTKFFIVCVDLNISINAPTILLENVGVTSRVE